MADTTNRKELINNTTADEDALNAFNADVRLAEMQERIDRGEITADQKAFFDQLNPKTRK
jgi:hypothetical protein